jgi:tetratricopeptide (TPR) repeat protein
MLQRRVVIGFFIVASIGLSRNLLSQSSAPPRDSSPITDSIASHYLAITDSASLAPNERAAWQRRLDAAHDTLEAVLSWYHTAGRGDEELRMLTALGRFWDGLSLVNGFDRALALPKKQPVVRARALNSAAAAAFRVKDRDRTRQWAIESIAIFRSLGDSSGMGRAYERLVQLALRDGDHAPLRALADTGNRLCAHAHDEDCQAYLLNMRGESARVLKQYDSAAVYYDRAGTIYARLSPVPRLDIAHNVGFTLLALGRSEEARKRFQNGMRDAVAVGSKRFYGAMLAGLASADAVERKGVSAAKLFGMSDAQLEQLGIVADPADAVEYERYRSLARKQLGNRAFDAAVKRGRAIPLDSVMVHIH